MRNQYSLILWTCQLLYQLFIVILAVLNNHQPVFTTFTSSSWVWTSLAETWRDQKEIRHHDGTPFSQIYSPRKQLLLSSANQAAIFLIVNWGREEIIYHLTLLLLLRLNWYMLCKSKRVRLSSSALRSKWACNCSNLREKPMSLCEGNLNTFKTSTLNPFVHTTSS